MDINKIFNLFEGNPNKDPVDDISLLVDFSDHPLYWIGGFNKLINNYIYFSQYLIEKPNIDKDKLEISDILLYNKAWEYIKKLNINNSIHLDCLKVKSSESLYNTLEAALKFFEKYEEYEKCAFLKQIQEKVKGFLI